MDIADGSSGVQFSSFLSNLVHVVMLLLVFYGVPANHLPHLGKNIDSNSMGIVTPVPARKNQSYRLCQEILPFLHVCNFGSGHICRINVSICVMVDPLIRERLNICSP